MGYDLSSIHEDVGLIPGLDQWVSGLRIQHCCELWYRLQTQLGSLVAVAVVKASSCSSDLTPSLGTSLGCRYSSKKQNKKRTKKPKNGVTIWFSNPSPGHVSGKKKTLNSKRYTYPNVHSSTIYNSQDMEAM